MDRNDLVFGLLVPRTIGPKLLVPLPWTTGTTAMDDWSHGLLVPCTYHVPCTILRVTIWVTYSYWCFILHFISFSISIRLEAFELHCSIVGVRLHVRRPSGPCQTSADTDTDTHEHGHIVKRLMNIVSQILRTLKINMFWVNLGSFVRIDKWIFCREYPGTLSQRYA